MGNKLQHGHLDADDGGVLSNLPLSILANQSPNKLLAGPASGVAGPVTARDLVTADIPDGLITSAKLADTAVTTGKLDTTGVTADIYGSTSSIPQITVNAQGRVTGASNQGLSVATGNIQDGAVTMAKLADGSVTTARLAASAVTSAKIGDAEIITAKIADGNVTTAKLATGAVTSNELAANAVITAKITDGNVTTAKLAAGAVTSNELAANAVITAKIADAAVTTGKLDTTGVTAGTYGSASTIPQVTVNAQGRVTSVSNQAVSAGTSQIQDGSVTQAKLASSSVGTGQLRTATGSSTGNFSFDNVVDITMNDYAFAPSVTCNVGAVDVRAKVIADPSNTIAALRLFDRDAGGSTTTYAVRWRYMTSSDDPTIWIAHAPTTGAIKAVWASDDPTPGDVPGVKVEGCQVKKYKARDLAPLALESDHLTAAKNLIAANGLKTDHLLYRALQVKANDAAPAQWLLDNCRVDPVTTQLLRKAA